MLASTSLLAVAWIGGYNGVGILPPLPTALGLHETAGVPSEPVIVHGEPGVATVAAANAVTGGINGTLTEYDASSTPDGIGPGDGTSEFYGSSAHLSFWALTAPQHAAWVAVRVVPLLGAAVVWGLLLLLVRDIRRGHGFTTRAARRIAGIGLLVAVGLVLMVVALAWREAAGMRRDLEGLV